jgi:uncharacterized protein (DUF433 family)
MFVPHRATKLLANVEAGVTAFEPQSDPYDEPAYRASEAAHILALPLGTVQAWCFGHDYRHRDGGRKHFARVIAPTDARRRLLSFINLCELHLLGVIRRHHRVRLPQVRAAMRFMQERLGHSRPLVSASFRTNGIDLFVEHADELLNVSRAGQQALREDFERSLARVEFAADGQPVRLFPYTRAGRSESDAPRSVLVDPRRSFGRPVLATAFVRTEVVADRFEAGDSIAEMAGDYRVSPAEIEEALRFEQRRAA